MQWDDIRLDRDGGIIVGDLLNGWPEDGEPNMNNDLTVYESALEIATLNAANKVLQARVAELEGALRPFSQPDLCLRLGGNSPREGSSAVVFQRNKAILRLADFDAAKQALGGDDNDK